MDNSTAHKRTLEEEQGVEEFKRFLRIKTISQEGHKGANQEAVTFLEALLSQLGLQTRVLEIIRGKVAPSHPSLLSQHRRSTNRHTWAVASLAQPILIATLVGEEPSLPSILLNSHYDVVPAVASMWKVPFTISHRARLMRTPRKWRALIQLCSPLAG
jgi:aminoacylase